jgi:mono/diheme cytochrome c family protein
MRLAAAALFALVLSSCAQTPAPPEAIESGDAIRGFAFAQRNCATCHAITAGDAWSPDPLAPSFQTVADTPGMSGRAVNVWLASDHPSMPHLIVAPEDGDDVWAYMRTLRTR